MIGISKIYLANQAADTLRKAIQRGDFGEVMPNIRVLGRSLGISVPNVIRALRILQVEGYIVAQRGRATRIVSRKPQKTSQFSEHGEIVCFIGFSPERLYESIFYYGVSDQLRGMNIAVVFLQYTLKEWEISGGVASIGKRFDPKCCVLVGAPPLVQQQFQNARFNCLLASCVPYQGIEIPYAEIDFKALYRHAANQFLSRGHKRVHLLMERKSAEKSPEAVRAFTSIIEGRRNDGGTEAILQTHDGTPQGFVDLLARLFKNRNSFPTGLLISYVHFYVLAQTWLSQSRFRIPDDVSLVSRDSNELIDYLRPVPCHYRYNTEVAQRRIVRTILSLIKGNPVKRAILTLPEFNEGETLKELSRSN